LCTHPVRKEKEGLVTKKNGWGGGGKITDKANAVKRGGPSQRLGRGNANHKQNASKRKIPLDRSVRYRKSKNSGKTRGEKGVKEANKSHL